MRVVIVKSKRNPKKTREIPHADFPDFVTGGGLAWWDVGDSKEVPDVAKQPVPEEVERAIKGKAAKKAVDADED